MGNRVTTHEAARRLNYSEATIRAAIDSGALKAEKFAGAWIITEGDFSEFVETLPVERRALVLIRELADREVDCGADGCGWRHFARPSLPDYGDYDSSCVIARINDLAKEGASDD